MRNLTVKREKRYVGCLAKVHLYVEDPTSNDIVINQVKCRKLGELKNGEEKTFAIEDHELRVFAIIDKLSKGYCNDFYKIPAGYEDVSLQGRCAFNSFSGYAFMFDGVTDEEALQNRKKNKKKGAIIGVIAIIVGFLIGFGSVYYSDSAPSPQTFSSNGVKITLTDDFIKVPAGDFTICYSSDDLAVVFLEERFDVYEGLEDYTLKEYGERVIEINHDPSTQLNEENGLMYFKYKATNPDSGNEYSYIAFVYETSEAFWLVQFGVLTEDVDDYYQDIFNYAKSIKFTK
ncbi:MAG: hypothetical protein J6M35_05865 [Clostridia bacterium]|nr:hypothetical protein [Clostridia bacterium]